MKEIYCIERHENFKSPVVIISKGILAMAQNKFYVVVRGIKPGIYDLWFGENGAEEQVKGFPNALHQGFKTLREAEEWYYKKGDVPSSSSEIKGDEPVTQGKSELKKASSGIGENQTKESSYSL